MKSNRADGALAIFERVKASVIERLSEGDRTVEIVTLLHCPEVLSTAPKGQRERSYAHVGHWPDVICIDLPRFEKLPIEHQVGIFLHEFGHIGAPFAGEEGADRWVFEELGIALTYRGKKILQWVSASDIRKFGI